MTRKIDARLAHCRNLCAGKVQVAQLNRHDNDIAEHARNDLKDY